MSENSDNLSGYQSKKRKRGGSVFKWMIRLPLYFLSGVLFLLGGMVLLLQTGFVRDMVRGFLVETANRQLNANVGIERIDGNLLSDVSIEGISITTKENQPVLTVDRVSASYLLPMMLSKVVHVSEARIEGLRLNMVKLPDGKWNISTLVKPSEKADKSGSATPPLNVALMRFEIADALLSIDERAQEMTTSRSLWIERFVAGFNYGETIRLSILESSMALKAPETLPIAMNGEVVFDPEISGIEIDNFIIRSDASKISVDGECRFQRQLPVFNATIGIDGVDPGDVGRRLLVSGLPEGAVSGDITISGTTADTRHRIFLKQALASVEIDGSTGFNETMGLWTDLSGRINDFDLSALGTPLSDHLAGTLSTDIAVKASGLDKPETMDGRGHVKIRGVTAADIPLDVVQLNADCSRGKIMIERLEILSGDDRLGISGSIEPLNRSAGLDLSIHSERIEVLLDRLAKHRVRLPDSLAFKGKTDITATVGGWLNNPHARIALHTGEVSYDRIWAKATHLTGIWRGLPGPGNHIDDLVFTAEQMGFDQVGTGMLSLSGRWSGWIDDPSAAISINARNIAGDRMNIGLLDLTGDFKGIPTDEESRANLTLNAAGLRMERIESGTLSLTGSWRGPFSGYLGHAELNTRETKIQDNKFKGLSLTVDVTPDEAVISAAGDHENGSGFEIDGKAAPWTTPERDITIENLRLSTLPPWPKTSLINAEPIRFSLAGNSGVKVHTCRLEMDDAKIDIEGELSADGEQEIKVAIGNLEIGKLPGNWNEEAGLSGTVSTETNIRGTLSRPIVSSKIDIKNLTGYGISKLSDLDVAVDYAGEKAVFQATLFDQNTTVLSANGSIPVRFSLAPFSASETEGSFETTLQTRKLRFSELPIPRIKGVEWDAVADMNLHAFGSLREPGFSGDITINNGHITLTRNKLTYEQAGAKLSLSDNLLTVEELVVAGDREGRISASGVIGLGNREQFNADLQLSGDNFYIPFQKAVSARVSPRLHLKGGLNNPNLTGEVTITESRINLDRLAEQQYSDIQVVNSAPEDGNAPLIVASEPQGPGLLSPLSADILVRVPKNAWLKGQDVNAEIGGEVTIKKRSGEAFLLTGPLHTIRGNYYFMGKNFHLTKGNVEFLGLKEINPNLNIEARTRIKSTDIIVTLHGIASEIAIDLSSDPVMEESDIISYLVFGKASDSLGGDKAFNVEKAALGYTSGLLAGELRNLLGDVFFIDSFAIDSADGENGFGSVTLGKYITPEIYISHRQGLTENDQSYEEITYELTPQLKLETQIGRDSTSSGDLIWEFDF